MQRRENSSKLWLIPVSYTHLSDTAQLDKNFVKAFVTNIGGRTSHSAIMARTLEIAAVLGTNNITELVKDGDIIAANGITGEVIILSLIHI